MAFEAPEVEISSNVGDPSDIRHITGVVSLPTGASTAARQDSQATLLTSIDNKTPSLVSGRQPVDGSGVTQPVSGPLTDAQLRATAVPVKIADSGSQFITSTLINSKQRLDSNLSSEGVDNAALPFSTTRVGGAYRALLQTYDNGDLSDLQLDVNGNLKTVKYDPPSYSAAVGFAPQATPTDVFTLIGSATKTIKILKIRLTGTTTSGSPISTNISLIKRSTANTGGVRVAMSAVPHDSNSAAATASAGNYTTNPTALGTATGSVRIQRVSFNATGITGGDVVWEFNLNEPIVLRGVAQSLAINMGGITVTGNIVGISIEWQEV